MDKDAFLLKVKTTQMLNSGESFDLAETLHKLKDLSPTDEFFATQVSDIINNIADDKIDDVLHVAKTLSRISFMKLMNRLLERRELTMKVIQNYKDQFGEDNDILLAELTLLFGKGYEQYKDRIDAIMKVVS